MKKSRTLLTLAGLLLCVSLFAQTGKTSIYDFSVTSNTGESVSLEQYRGKTLLIVNTASKCGFTPQYEGLEALNRKYTDRGLVVIGFPCNQFGGQEPLSNAEIAEFCSSTYSVTFPLMAKIDVNGDGADPLYDYLKSETGGGNITWNFVKFLVSQDGTQIKRFNSRIKPENLASDIEAFLK